jgi:hypothetical protein
MFSTSMILLLTLVEMPASRAWAEGSLISSSSNGRISCAEMNIFCPAFCQYMGFPRIAQSIHFKEFKVG